MITIVNVIVVIVNVNVVNFNLIVNSLVTYSQSSIPYVNHCEHCYYYCCSYCFRIGLSIVSVNTIAIAIAMMITIS